MKTIAATILVSLAAVVGCAASAPEPQNPSTAAAPTTFTEQVALGGKLYADNCASCHGSSGEGKKAPRLVGLKDGAIPLNPPAGAKYRKSQFKTVGDVADFVMKTMPADNPGSLQPDQYWAILAYDLKANGFDLDDKKLDAAVASTLTIPR